MTDLIATSRTTATATRPVCYIRSRTSYTRSFPPSSEKRSTSCSSTSQIPSPSFDTTKTMPVTHFPSNYLLSPTIIGRIICNEVQQLFIPKAPINFCGLLDNISINALLDTRLPSVVLSATWSGICVGLCATKHRQQVPPDQR